MADSIYDLDVVRDSVQTAMDCVQEFHLHAKVDAKMRITAGAKWLESVGDRLVNVSSTALTKYKETDDVRYLRAHLMLEELGECLVAMGEGDEQGVLDALADLLYVLLGSAVALDLPLAEAFAEVHRSNMSKERQPDDPDGARVRAKGPNYSPPDIARILAERRAGT